MLVEMVAIGGVSKFFHDVGKASEISEKALRKCAKAFEIETQAVADVKKKADLVEKRLNNVINKKKSIIEYSIPKFMEVYSPIQKICREENTVLLPDKNMLKKIDSLEKLGTISKKKTFTNKELLCGLLRNGFGGMMIKDSERLLSAANCQISEANVVRSEAEAIISVYNSVIERADRIAQVLAKLNCLFIKSIESVERTIRKNGTDVGIYNDFDKGILMTCVNLVQALSEIIDVPVIDEEGKIPQYAEKMIETGERCVLEIQNAIDTL